MSEIAKWVPILGVAFMLASIVFSTGLARDGSLPLPLAVCGAGLFVGGSIQAKK